ncbi:hypothetical protein N7532_002786 [Penicillium argentinense]|uniref:Uncharacterized protein n=1 Tax=Penicillium argentinense TaxID=1131581 RepID=A0A9W9G118_9EURO|nr:uncharacterized protein N7532_002786 [Penicillium argentinense]KAJ5110141.1 hypothetical protein N7532_002786 [Penicillium argentinense]
MAPPVPSFTGKVYATSANFIVRYRAIHSTPVVASRYLTASNHPIRPKIAHMYDHREKDHLWWRVNINMQIQHVTRVVRSWAARRTRVAFLQALKNNGLDHLGKVLPEAKSWQQPLIGTMEVVVREYSLTSNFETIQQDANSLLQNILKLKHQKESLKQSSPKKGKFSSKPPRSKS